MPPAEVARTRARFESVCRNQFALPGSGITPVTLDVCASALDSSACELPDGPPPECDFHGSLAGRAACTDGVQCQSGSCAGTASVGPGEQVSPFTCGTCAPLAVLGATCGDASCSANAICITQDTTAASPIYVCTALTQGGVGAACDGLTALCQPGSYCASATKTCNTLGHAGASCGEGTGDWAGGCAAPLACVNSSGGQVCSSGATTGAFCLTDFECATGLGCLPGPCSSSGARIGCAESGTCGAVAWNAPGEACDGYAARCLVGSCGSGAFSSASAHRWRRGLEHVPDRDRRRSAVLCHRSRHDVRHVLGVLRWSVCVARRDCLQVARHAGIAGRSSTARSSCTPSVSPHQDRRDQTRPRPSAAGRWARRCSQSRTSPSAHRCTLCRSPRVGSRRNQSVPLDVYVPGAKLAVSMTSCHGAMLLSVTSAWSKGPPLGNPTAHVPDALVTAMGPERPAKPPCGFT